MTTTSIIILAAGSSSRLGQAKQQLFYKGKTLLQHAIETALGSQAAQVLVVLGANASSIAPQISHYTISLLQNNDWETGMASSIKVGLKAVQEWASSPNHALFMLCDQPLITSEILNALMQTKEQTHKVIIGCSYANTIGAPVLFDASLFEELLQLTGQEGAKKLLTKYPDKVVAVPFPEASLDIDTQQDYQVLQQLEPS
jgi:molybdenum cofactor cytidylyltransferase